jgi:excisionase family DNA binding protein
MQIEPNRQYTLDEAAELLHVSRRTIQRHTRSGALPARLLGRRVYIRGDALLNLPSYTPPADASEYEGGFTLGKLAQHAEDGSLTAMAKMLNEVGPVPRYDESEPDADARVSDLDVVDLFVRHANDQLGCVLRELLADALRRARVRNDG